MKINDFKSVKKNIFTQKPLTDTLNNQTIPTANEIKYLGLTLVKRCKSAHKN